MSRLAEALRRAALRCAWALLALAGALVLTLALTQLLPGDPARLLAGPRARPADVERLRASYGLDRSFAVQVSRAGRRLVHAAPADARPDKAHRSCRSMLGLHMDLGFSFVHGKPVAELIGARASRSLELATGAALVQLLLGVGLGLAGAARAGRSLDRFGAALALVLFAAPTFLTGLALQLAFAVRLPLLPVDGVGSGGAHLASLALPCLTLGLFATAVTLRVTRLEVGRALASDWIRTARATGAGPARRLAHAARASLPAILTVFLLEVGALASGAMVTESLFRWPGLGWLAVDAIQNRDGPLLVGATLASAAAVLASTVALDLALFAVDPRRRRS